MPIKLPGFSPGPFYHAGQHRLFSPSEGVPPREHHR